MTALMEKVRIGEPLARCTQPDIPKSIFSASLFDNLPLLDDFNRANEDPLSQSGDWNIEASRFLGATQTLEITSNQAAQLDVTSTGRSIRRVPLGSAQAASVTIATLPVDSDDAVSIFLRAVITGDGNTFSRGYELAVFPPSGSNEFRIQRWSDPSTQTIVAQESRSISAGDKIGFLCYDRFLEGWHFNGTSWTNVVRGSDSTFIGSGCLGLGIRDNEARLADFRGGEL